MCKVHRDNIVIETLPNILSYKSDTGSICQGKWSKVQSILINIFGKVLPSKKFQNWPKVLSCQNTGNCPVQVFYIR